MDVAKAELGLSVAMSASPWGLNVDWCCCGRVGRVCNDVGQTASHELREETDELIDSTSDLRLEYKDFKNTIDDKNKSTISEIEAAKNLIPNLFPENQKTKKTREHLN